MHTKPFLIALTVAWACASGSHHAQAAWPFHRHREGTPPPGRPRQFDQSLARAGHPETFSGHATVSNTPEYQGYYVGGGVAHGGGPRHWQEGTWGWDYEGCYLRRRVALGWSHGRRFQGGDRYYRNATPHFPDVFIVPRHGSGEGE